ncbi:hypothetical protein EVAR_57524_1 [Eumeta japonica]|uniref:Uncharacterized protein n=1 Tax=Eumeta variegata TaxID=151549 RepID=A0A4C1Y189_EUMVA|nr:hypothetical protein EVAR_57524_1 [Eumeta japonica]
MHARRGPRGAVAMATSRPGRVHRTPDAKIICRSAKGRLCLCLLCDRMRSYALCSLKVHEDTAHRESDLVGNFYMLYFLHADTIKGMILQSAATRGQCVDLRERALQRRSG